MQLDRALQPVMKRFRNLTDAATGVFHAVSCKEVFVRTIAALQRVLLGKSPEQADPKSGQQPGSNPLTTRPLFANSQPLYHRCLFKPLQASASDPIFQTGGFIRSSRRCASNGKRAVYPRFPLVVGGGR
jgi:hypothetical protein